MSVRYADRVVWARSVTVALLVAGCSYSPTSGDVDVVTSSTTSGAAGSSSSSTGSTAETSTGEAPDDGNDSDAGGFIPYADLPPGAFECDLFMQDCPRGEKCTIWAYNGGAVYNGLRCVPVVEDPVGWQERCTVTPPETSGLDDCELGAFCWRGVCKPFCQGSAFNPTCPDGYWCHASDAGSLVICLTHCDPLGTECPEGAPCTATGDKFDCVPDAAEGSANVGDPCEYDNVCGAAKACISAEDWPGCEGTGCCAPYCDHTQPDADAECDAAGSGTVCVPWFAPGEAIPGLEHVGVCRVP